MWPRHSDARDFLTQPRSRVALDGPCCGFSAGGAPGPKSEIDFRPLPEDDPIQRQPDITLAREKLAWEPGIALRDGLTRTIEWFRSVDMSTFRAPTPNY